MTTWRTGTILNLITGIILILFPFLILTNVLPDVEWINEIEYVMVRSKIFALGNHWWRLVVFVWLWIIYFGMSVFLPHWVLRKTVMELDPRHSISTSMFTVYTLLFGLFTVGGLFFLISLFTVRKGLWRQREYKFRDQIEELDNFEEEPDSFSVVEEVPSYEREIREEIREGRERRERFDNTDVSRNFDRLERRIDDVEDDLYHEKRKNRKVNKTLDDIEDILSKR